MIWLSEIVELDILSLSGMFVKKIKYASYPPFQLENNG